ncbi:MAG TPA: D-glycero-beta-D-manno-heptose-7-phosphate kinase [Verrucomicrobiae bacterium]|nr:D-glycero-beta-D-manno-heptose-7-phosphate kinase [Verrucomicrobiae bacterium]
MKGLSPSRVRQILAAASQRRLLVIGDVMLDQFIWGRVSRISPEAPVPVVEVERESFMPGGAANVARNLTALGTSATLFGVVGPDAAAKQLSSLLAEQQVDCSGLLPMCGRMTTRKVRVIAHQQQVARVDRETRGDLDDKSTRRFLKSLEETLLGADAVIVGDYGKGVVTQSLLDEIKQLCRSNGVWLSFDPKPVHHLNLNGLSLITPNRKEAFELADVQDVSRTSNPLQDTALMEVTSRLLTNLSPALLLITLGDQGMLLCQRGQKPFHIPTAAQEVFDVSGAGDTVIASFTLAIAAGASPIEAAIFSNHAAGVVVGKVGTATVTPEELLASFKRKP